MKRIVLSSMFIATMMAFAACSSNQSNDSKEVAEDLNEQKFDSTQIEDDTEFAVDAADGGLLEVKLGELAQTNGSSPAVKEFGKMMVTEHSKANEELAALATQKNISLPLSLSADNQKKVDDFTKKTGKDFDKAYADLMVEDHKEDLEDFQEAAKEGKDPEVKAWAAGKVATLEQHLAKAKALKDGVK